MRTAIARLKSLQALAITAQGQDSADAATIGSAIARLEPLADTYSLPDNLWPPVAAETPTVTDTAPTVTPPEQVTPSPAPADAIVDANTPASGVEPMGSVEPAQPPAAVVEGDGAQTTGPDLSVTENAAPVDQPQNTGDSSGGTDPAQPTVAEPVVDVDPTPADKETIASIDARVDALERKAKQ